MASSALASPVPCGHRHPRAFPAAAAASAAPVLRRVGVVTLCRAVAAACRHEGNYTITLTERRRLMLIPAISLTIGSLQYSLEKGAAKAEFPDTSGRNIGLEDATCGAGYHEPYSPPPCADAKLCDHFCKQDGKGDGTCRNGACCCSRSL
ncbi:hypothetical protein ZWY2020_043085 [Hordeum vulgare]|nr:hypothetical protein ZWY2020_043085 [Hordeum vulgare]